MTTDPTPTDTPTPLDPEGDLAFLDRAGWLDTGNIVDCAKKWIHAYQDATVRAKEAEARVKRIAEKAEILGYEYAAIHQQLNACKAELSAIKDHDLVGQANLRARQAMDQRDAAIAELSAIKLKLGYVLEHSPRQSSSNLRIRGSSEAPKK